ncbi:MAG TPA: hypothetical protein VGP99_03065 [Tepidisphaeraceae bacterium]|jgi:hypothetical protein|nr:hypothetical protein [Tepidisphaeraceae bacterium]
MRRPTILIALGIFCALISLGCSAMTPGDVGRVQPISDQPYAGNVYLLRGFIGIWSFGINDIGKRIAESGIRASVYQENQWDDVCHAITQKYENNPNHEPLIIIGHSYGADDALKMARKLQQHNITIDLIITLDPVTPPKVPTNVRLCYNIYQPGFLDMLPFFRGVKLEAERDGNLQNVNIRGERRDLLEPNTDHFNIEKNRRIHEEIVRKVKEFCPPRGAWVAAHHPQNLTAKAPINGVQTLSNVAASASGNSHPTRSE